eukprot:jgi/Psemu1/12953/gm1.12953_g
MARSETLLWQENHNRNRNRNRDRNEANGPRSCMRSDTTQSNERRRIPIVAGKTSDSLEEYAGNIGINECVDGDFCEVHKALLRTTKGKDEWLDYRKEGAKYKWDFTPPSQRSQGALTQEAALGLLDMIKPEDQRAQMTARMEVAMRRVGCELIMDGDKGLPLVIDEAAASNVDDNDDNNGNNMIEEITETEQPTAAAAATTTTDNKTIDLALDERPTRPARVFKPSRSILQNP